MKRQFAWILAILSGLYLLTIGLLPDPLLIVDEAMALLIFVKSTAWLGYDVTKWIPFIRKGKVAKYPGTTRPASGEKVDI